MIRFYLAMKSVSAFCIACLLYQSIGAMAQESETVEGEIYVPAMKATARFVAGSPYEEVGSELGESRESRKVGLLRGMWKRPRVSPLYLVNGTICRFVNSAPICTTLATTGLGINGNNNGINNFNPNNLSQFGNNQQFPLNNNINNQQFSNRNNNNQLYTPGNNNQFNRQQPQFVSSAINEEESQEVAVHADASGSSENQSTETQQQQMPTSSPKPVQPQPASASNKPVVANRRPLLPLRLPLRQFSIG